VDRLPGLVEGLIGAEHELPRALQCHRSRDHLVRAADARHDAQLVVAVLRVGPPEAWIARAQLIGREARQAEHLAAPVVAQLDIDGDSAQRLSAVMVREADAQRTLRARQQLPLSVDLEVVGRRREARVVHVQRADNRDRGRGGQEVAVSHPLANGPPALVDETHLLKRVPNQLLRGLDRRDGLEGLEPCAGLFERNLTDAAGFAVFLNVHRVIRQQAAVQVSVDEFENVA
jgi:hypothetical protein